MANRVSDTARDEANAPVSGATASLRLIGGGEIASTTTDAGGFYAFDEDTVGYPGPIFVRVTDTNGVSRERTSNSTGKTGTIFMSDLARAFLMMTDGVFSGVGDELSVAADGVTMNLAIDDGMAFIYGHPCYIAAPLSVTVAANGNVNPRIDLVVMRLVPPGAGSDEGSITPEIVQGTPAASPVAPGVTQDPNTVWELPLAQILVDPSVSAIAVGKVTDVRTYTSGPLTDDSVVTAKLADLAVTTIKIAANAVTAAKISNGTDYSTTAIAKVLKANVSANATPLWASLLLSELADVAETAPTNGQVLVYDTATTSWKPGSATSITIVVQEGDVTVDASVTTLDFAASEFAVTSTPAGEANIAIDRISATKVGADTSISDAEYGHLNGVSSNIQTQLNAKSATTHTHTLRDEEMNRPTFAASGTLASGSRDLYDDDPITLDNGIAYECEVFTAFEAKNNVNSGTFTTTITIDGTTSLSRTFQTVGGVPRECTWVSFKEITGSGAAINVKVTVAHASGDATDFRSGYVFVKARPLNVPAS